MSSRGIPGIIEGAGEGAGLGLRFLKHIARSAGLAFVIDPVDTDVAASYRTLLAELEQYDRTLLSKPRLLIITKADLSADAAERRSRVDALVGADVPAGVDPTPSVITVSAHTGEGMDELRRALLRLTLEGRRREEVLREDVTREDAARHREDDDAHLSD